MENFVNYIENLNAWFILDVAIILAVAIPIVIFFVNKKQFRLLLIMVGVVAISAALEIASAYSKTEIFVIGKIIMRYVVGGMIIAAIVVYRGDIKTLFGRLTNKRTKDLYAEGYGDIDELRNTTSEILEATQDMAKKNTGAIMLLTSGGFPPKILETGTKLNAEVSAGLLESIFITKGPIHDGAVVIMGSEILAAGCYLPLTQNTNIGKEFGTRHRAAIGITEETDALAIVVSEETGIISIAKNGDLRRYITIEKLKEAIEDQFGISPSAIAERDLQSAKHTKKRFRK